MRIEKNTVFIGLTSIGILLLFIVMGIVLGNKTTSKLPITTAVTKAASFDSVKQQFATTVNNFDHRLTTAINNKDSSLQIQENDLLEYYKLKNEISTLLKDSLSSADIDLAKRKIVILEYKIEQLNTKNVSIEADNKRLNAIITKLMQQDKAPTNTTQTIDLSSVVSNTTPVRNTNQGVDAASNGTSFSSINFMALNENNGDVSLVDNVKKLAGTFSLKSNTNITNAEIMVVVQQPDGKVIKNSDWESGLFQTKEGFRKIYSLVLRFDYAKGTNKQCNFSINTDELPSGKYTLQLYYKGSLVGQTSKVLS